MTIPIKASSLFLTPCLTPLLLIEKLNYNSVSDFEKFSKVAIRRIWISWKETSRRRLGFKKNNFGCHWVDPYAWKKTLPVLSTFERNDRLYIKERKSVFAKLVSIEVSETIRHVTFETSPWSKEEIIMEPIVSSRLESLVKNRDYIERKIRKIVTPWYLNVIFVDSVLPFRDDMMQ